MPQPNAAQTIRDHVNDHNVSELLQKHLKLRHRERHAFLRLILACPDELVTPQKVAWEKLEVSADALATAVTEEELVAWVTPTRPVSLLRRIVGILHAEVAEPVTVERYLEIVAARAPAGFAKATDGLFGQGRSEEGRKLFERFASAYVDGLIGEPRNLNATNSSILDRLPVEDLGRFLEHAAGTDDIPQGNHIRTLNRAASVAPVAFATLAARCVLKTKKNEVTGLWVEMHALNADGIRQILDGVKGKDAHFTRMAFLAAVSRTPAAADAFASFLGHKKRGRLCARWLTQLGAEGRRAAETAAAGATKKSQTDTRVRELAGAVAKLPEAPSFLVNIGNRADSAWHLDPSQFAFEAPASELAAPPHAPIDLADAKRVLEDTKHAADDLSPEHWADLLQVVTTPGWWNDLAWARELAITQGRLGWGADPAKLVEAVERFNVDQTIKLGWGSEGAIGLYHMLLGAGAPRAVLLHALALIARHRGPMVMHCVKRNFEDPLEEWKPEDHVALGLHALHLQLVRTSRVPVDEFCRFPTLEEASSAGPAWTSEADHTDFRLRLTVSGASRIVVRFRKDAEFSVDLSTRRWAQQGLGDKKAGATSLFGDEGAVHVGLEAVGPLVRIGVNGTLIGDMPRGKIFEVQEDESALVVETDGRIDRVQVTGAGSQKAAGDHALLIGFADKKTVRDVAAAETSTAALALAAVASLSDDEDMAKLAGECLAQMSAVATPWRGALGMEQVEAKEAVFEVRSFEACIAAFGTLKKGEVKRVEGVQDFALAVGFKNPGKPNWSAGGAISEPTLYLDKDEKKVPDIESLLDTSLPAIITWNSRGTGQGAAKAETWTVMACHDLAQEQDEDWGGGMTLILAAWKVEEGVAYAAWDGSGEKLAEIMGLPEGWPSRRAWADKDVWIGE